MEHQYGQYSAADASVDERASFITKTYLHLLGAIVAFVGLEAFYFVSGIAGTVANVAFGGGRLFALLFLGGFVATSWVADAWARNATSRAMQYAGLALYVVAESIFFIPLLALAIVVADDFSIVGEAGLTTLVLFGGLTGVVFLTRKDFSFLRGILMFGGIAAFGLALASLLFGFTLGLAFSRAMLALAAGYILFHTSAVLHHYRPDQHVSAALALFSSVALLFWYVLRILLASRR